MNIKKGEIYLANLGDVKCADIGKIRPVLIFQNDNLIIWVNLYNVGLSHTLFKIPCCSFTFKLVSKVF